MASQFPLRSQPEDHESDDEEEIKRYTFDLCKRRYLTFDVLGNVKFIPPPPAKNMMTADKLDGGWKTFVETSVIPVCPFSRL